MICPFPLYLHLDQVLNRDLWSNPGVKAIISEHFVFWQQYKVQQPSPPLVTPSTRRVTRRRAT